MSHTAFVAFQTESGYDLYYSHNGAEDYRLKRPLEQWISDPAATRDAFNVPDKLSNAAEDVIQFIQTESSLPATKSSYPVITPNPSEINIPKHELLDSFDAYEAEVLYVVESDTVRTFIPVSPSTDVYQWLHDYGTIEIYRYETTDQLQILIENLADIDPAATVTGTDIAKKVLPQPAWAVDAFIVGHRYLAKHVISGLVETPQDLTDAVTALDTTLLVTTLQEDVTVDTVRQPEQVTVPAIPVEVSYDPIANTAPSINQNFSSIDTTHPKVLGAKHRHEAYFEDDIPRGGIAPNLIERLSPDYADAVATEYLPAALK